RQEPTCKVSHFPRLHPQGRQCAGRQLRRLPLETLGADQHPIGTAIPATPVPDLLIQSSDFWRGVVDGDGSLGILASEVCILWARKLTQAARSIFALSQE